MAEALAEAISAAERGEVPVGAVLANDDGIVARDGNRVEALGDPTAHAELLVLRAGASALGRHRLMGCDLFVTLEPCAMCAGAAVQARLDRIVYGAADLKAGAAWSLYNIPQDRRLNHRIDLVAGVLEDECAALLTGFFSRLRDDRKG